MARRRDRIPSPSCIHGVRPCWAIITSIAWSPAADCPPIIRDGFPPATRCSCCPIPVLHNVFRKKFLAGLRQLYRKNRLDCRGPAADFRDPGWFEQLVEEMSKKDWYVYAKPPGFGGPEHVLGYLGRCYTHRMAISNHRITAFDGEHVSFTLARLSARRKTACHAPRGRGVPASLLPAYVLPRGFVRIRHYGLLANRYRKQLLPLARTLLAAQGREPLPLPPPPDCDLWHCPRCGATHARR